MWRHNPIAATVSVANEAICSVSDIPQSSPDYSEGLRTVRGLLPGRTTFTLGFDNDLDVVMEVEVVGATQLQLALPTIEIDGPSELEVGETGYYNCNVVGGRYTYITAYQWSCLGTGQTGPNAYVDTTGRTEGVYQLCCTVHLELLLEDETTITRTAVGSVLIHIDEAD